MILSRSRSRSRVAGVVLARAAAVVAGSGVRGAVSGRRLGSPSRVAVSAARASPGATGRRRLLRPTRLEHAAPDHSRQGRAVHRPPPQSRTRRRPSCTCRPFPPWFCDRGRQLSRPAQTSATKIIPVEPARTYHPPRTRPRKDCDLRMRHRRRSCAEPAAPPSPLCERCSTSTETSENRPHT